MKLLARSASASGAQQFVIVCSAADADMAAGAMQYLPANYTLMVNASDWREKLGVLANDHTIMERVITESTEMSDEASPFSFGKVVLDEDTSLLKTPEAYASAALNAARAAA